MCEYVGEVITQVEATKRERSYSQLGLFYLHDIHGKRGTMKKVRETRQERISNDFFKSEMQ